MQKILPLLGLLIFASAGVVHAQTSEPEMKRLVVFMPEVYVRLAQREPFPNVPVNHWAAPSVERLRKRGILIGDPFGDF